MAPRNRFFDDEVVAQKFDMGLFKRMLQYVKPYKKKLFIGLAFMIVSMVLSLLSPVITQYIVDNVIPNKDMHQLFVMLGLLVGAIGISILLSTLKGIIMTRTGHSIIYDLRKQVFGHLQKLSFDYFDNRPTGKILVRITSYVDSLASLLSDGLVNLITDSLSIVVIIGIMAFINFRLTIVSLVMCIPLSIVLLFFKNKLHKKYQIVNNKNSNRTSYVHENIMGAKVIQAFNRETINEDIYANLNTDATTAWLSAYKMNNLLWPCVDIINIVGVALTYYVGFVMLKWEMVTLGTILAFTFYIARIWQPLNNLSAIYNQLLNAMANVERIFELIDEEPTIQDIENAQELPPITGAVDFQNVTFGYEEGANILENVSFHVKPGQTIALVGPSGAGKTTVISLLSRFYDIQGGQILVDGYNIHDVTLQSLRSQMGIIMQDSFIFEGSIIENIRYGKLDATDEEVIAAAKTAYAHDFIMRLPKGYYTKVDERGSSLSTGERQLLSFARVILSNPKILILDEATSCIDTKTEQNIQKALDALLVGRTSFIIAHRLSTIRNADNIMCVANKTIAEAGTHEELIAKKGLYYQLHKSQYQQI